MHPAARRSRFVHPPGRRAALLALAVLLVVVALATPATGATFVNWSAYLHGAQHSSYANTATAITPANAAGVTQAWHWTVPAATAGQPPARLYASPTVYNGRVYLGANTGVFYALNETTGGVVWKRLVGFTTTKSCSGKGFVATATVAPDASRAGQLTVYVAAGNGYLYAMRASDGSVVWRAPVAIPSATQSDFFNWASPTVANGRIYLGVSSDCDHPLVRGAVKAFAQASGAPLATYNTVPAGSVGGSVWSSVAANAASVWVTTGNADQTGASDPGDSFSMVRLDAATLAKRDSWTVPSLLGTDEDFGASPTLFTATIGGAATPMVGACNKNGAFYAWKAQGLSAGPVWSIRIGAAAANLNMCIGAAVWDWTGKRLFVPGNSTTINGVSYLGSLRRLNPATGALVWARGLPAGPVMGTPSLNGAGVIAAATYNLTSPTANRVYLLNAATGKILRQLQPGSPAWAQPVFADGSLLVATQTGGLFAYRP